MLLKYQILSRIVCTFIIGFASFAVQAQTGKGICKVETIDVSDFKAFGSMVYYSVEFKNFADKTVDGIDYTATFYNDADQEIDRRDDAYHASGSFKPIAQGFTKVIRKTVNIKGASKVLIKIKKITFFDGSTCE